ncbi:MAG TPA: NosD domain-containing protein [Acidimicrobiales bacterium]
MTPPVTDHRAGSFSRRSGRKSGQHQENYHVIVDPHSHPSKKQKGLVRGGQQSGRFDGRNPFGSTLPDLSGLTGGGGSGGFGAVVPKTANYTLVTGDSGKVFTFNGPNLVATLSGTVPSSPWDATIINVGSSPMTVLAGTGTLNGISGQIGVSLVPGQSITVFSNGASYWFARGDDGKVVFNVKDFGAVGDGVTDDYPACQAAINAAEALNPITGSLTFNPLLAQSVGVVVYFPPGVYFMGSGGLLVSGSGITVQGVGVLTSVLLVAHDSAYTPITVSGAGATAGVYPEFCEYVTIKDLGVWQNFGTATLTGSHAAGTAVGTPGTPVNLAISALPQALPVGAVVWFPCGGTPSFWGNTDPFTVTTAASIGDTHLTGYSGVNGVSVVPTNSGWAPARVGVIGSFTNTPGIQITSALSPHLQGVGVFHFGTGIKFDGAVDLICEDVRVTSFYANATDVIGLHLSSNVFSAYFTHCISYLPQGTYGPGTTSYCWYGYGAGLSDLGFHTCEADDATFGFYLRTTGGYTGDIRLNGIVCDSTQYGIWIEDFTTGNATIDIDSCWYLGFGTFSNAPLGTGLSPDGRGITIQNNTASVSIRGCQVIGDTTSINFWGICLDTASWVTISDNTIRGSFSQHIILIAATAVTITANTIDHVGTAGAGPNGVYLQASSYVSITGNIIASNPTTHFGYGILLDYQSSVVTMTGNIIDPTTTDNLIGLPTGVNQISTQGNVNYDTGGFVDPLTLLRTC